MLSVWFKCCQKGVKCCWKSFIQKVVMKLLESHKGLRNLSKSCQKFVLKCPNSYQTVFRKFSKSCQRVGRQILDSWQKIINKLPESIKKVFRELSDIFIELSENCQKMSERAIKLPESCQKFVKKFPESC